MADNKTLILSTMRDEGPYLLEWLAYHRAIGFTDFLIYTNDCRDGTDLLLDRLAQNGEVFHERNRVLKRGPQKSAYKAAMNHSAYLNADWVLASDVDEFLNIHFESGHIGELIKRFSKADVIPVCWRLFSHNGHEGFINGFSVTALSDAEAETTRSDDTRRFVKSIFRPRSDIVRIGSHAPVYTKDFESKAVWGAEWCEADTKANPRRPSSEFVYKIAQMNHYAVRTIDTFLLKRDRGDVNYMKNRLELQYWERWCRGGTEDLTIQRHLPAMRAEFDRLIADPVVKALHDAATTVHLQRLEVISAQPDVQRLKSEILKREGMTPTFSEPTTANPYTEGLETKAPKRHQNRLNMLALLPKGGRCAEIGVWNGGFSGCILEVTQPSELVLIDPWELLADQSSEEWNHKRHEDRVFMNKMYRNVTSYYGHLPSVEIRKGFSADVLAEYPDNYFDWVYIDGNHQYEFVKEDIEISIKKVKPGGIIAGDDFYWKKDGRRQVKEAVYDAMANCKIDKDRFLRLMGQQYLIDVKK